MALKRNMRTRDITLLLKFIICDILLSFSIIQSTLVIICVVRHQEEKNTLSLYSDTLASESVKKLAVW